MPARHSLIPMGRWQGDPRHATVTSGGDRALQGEPLPRRVDVDARWCGRAKAITLPDPFDNMGPQLVRTVASKSGDSAGDGTATAIMLGEVIVAKTVRPFAASDGIVGVDETRPE